MLLIMTPILHVGASVSLLGWFSHDKDPNFSIVVSSRGYTEIDQGIEF